MSTPIDTRVSIVEAPWRALTAAARWNGHPAQSTTGVASTSCTHGAPSRVEAGHHREDDDRHGEHGRDEGAALQRLLGRDLVGSGGDDLGAVPGGADGAEQVLDRDRLGEAHGGLLRGEVDDGVHAVEPAEPLLDPGRARGAGHARDREVDLVDLAAAGAAWSGSSRFSTGHGQDTP